jgi:YVTN family beta-propeller protein
MAANRDCYVSNLTSNNVTVIDAASDLVTHTIAVGAAPSVINETPDGSQVYVCNSGANTVSAINTVTFAVTTIALGAPALKPQMLAVTPDGKNVVVACLGTGATTYLAVIATGTNTLTQVLNVTAAGSTGPSNAERGVVFSADSTTAYVAGATGAGNGLVFKYNIAANTNTTLSIPPFFGGFSAASFSLCLSNDGTKLYSIDNTQQSVEVINPATFTLTTTIGQWTSQGFNGVLRPDNKFLYIAAQGDGVVVNTATNTFVQVPTILAGNAVQLPAATADNSTVYFGDESVGANLQILHTATNTFTSLNLGGGQQWMCDLSVNGDKLYVVDNTGGQVEIVNVPANTLRASPVVGTHPQFLTSSYHGGFISTTPPTYPGAQFIPKLFIPRKGQIGYSPDDMMADWLAIENWSQRWNPPPTVALFFPHKRTTSTSEVDANWMTLEVWGTLLKNLGAPYTPLFVPRKTSLKPVDMDTNWLAVQNWANRLPL